MTEHEEENEDLTNSPQGDSDVVSLIKKMQQQLNYLEKKINILIGGGQSSERPRFSKPFRPSFGGPKRDFNRGPRERSFSRDRAPRSDFSKDRPRTGGFERPREGGFSAERPRERSFDRPFERKSSSAPRSGGFSHGDKPFFRHRKGPR